MSGLNEVLGGTAVGVLTATIPKASKPNIRTSPLGPTKIPWTLFT
jgi:hypothetical protein